jgi:hypothetical protein
VGRQVYVDDDTSAASRPERLYWSYETWLKQMESRVSSVVGGDGAIMAVRRELFGCLDPDTACDFVLPLQLVARGYRGVYEPRAVCAERTAPSSKDEFRRKVRIINRSFLGTLKAPEILNPLRLGAFAVQLWFHKVLRWLMPLPLTILLAANLALVIVSGDLTYRISLAGQAILYGVAGAYYLGLTWLRLPGRLCYYFCLVNLAAAVAIFDLIRGKRYAAWVPSRAIPCALGTKQSGIS